MPNMLKNIPEPEQGEERPAMRHAFTPRPEQEPKPSE